MNPAHHYRVGLISCVKEKAGTARAARDLYVSDYFRKMRAYVERSCGEWRILSALHGLLHPDTVVEPYEQSLSAAGRDQRRQWARRVFEQLQAEFARDSQLVFEVHAGAAYADALVPLLRAGGYRVECPLSGLPIGARLHWYLTHRLPARTGLSSTHEHGGQEGAMDSSYANYLKVTEGSRVLQEYLQPFLHDELVAHLGPRWWTEGILPFVSESSRRQRPREGRRELIARLDPVDCLHVLNRNWDRVFRQKLSRRDRAFVNELIDTRHEWAHPSGGDISEDDAWRALDTMARLLASVESPGASRVRALATSVRQAPAFRA